MSRVSLRSKKVGTFRNLSIDETVYNLNSVRIGNTTSESIYIDNDKNSILIDEERDYNTLFNPFPRYSVRIGYKNGYENCRNISLLIGKECCYSNHITAPTNDPSGVICIGNKCGKFFKTQIGTCIGYECGANTQGNTCTAIGYKAGSNLQGSISTCIGYLAGSNCQTINGLSLGYKVGMNNTSNYSLAIGNEIGIDKCGDNSVAIGNSINNPPDNSVCIGNDFYFYNAISPGNYSNSVFIGNAFNANMGTGIEVLHIGNSNFIGGIDSYSLCIGNNNGNFVGACNSLGTNTICIGNYNSKKQHCNTIIIGNYNASTEEIQSKSIMIGNGINTTRPGSVTFNTYATDCFATNTMFINGAIRGSNMKVGYGKMWYDQGTKEVFYSID